MKNFYPIAAALMLLNPTSLIAKEVPPTQLSIPLQLTLTSPSYTIKGYFDALILEPFANNSDYGAEALPFNYGNLQPAVSPSWVIPQISPGFHFGFDLGATLVFHHANSSLTISWESYHSSNDTGSLVVASTNNMIGPFFEIGPDASVYKQAYGNWNYQLDEVNLDYGTFVNFGELAETNWFAGVSFARIVQHRFSQFSNLSQTIIRTLDVPATFMGAGPQLGFDFSYKIFQGLCFVGNGRSSLFVGTFTNSTTFSTTSPALASSGNLNPNIQTTQVNNKMGIVPEIESKLGLAYEWNFCPTYFARIEAGYLAQLYINAIRSVDLESEVALNAAGSIGSSAVGVYARTFQRTVSDFGLGGPYVTIELAF